MFEQTRRVVVLDEDVRAFGVSTIFHESLTQKDNWISTSRMNKAPCTNHTDKTSNHIQPDTGENLSSERERDRNQRLFIDQDRFTNPESNSKSINCPSGR